MKEYITLIIKGFFIGIAKIIPGVSGAVLAISLNVYDMGLNAITNFFSNTKKNFLILLFLFVGIVFSIIFFSKIINFCIKEYYFITMLFFLGLILGGIKNITSKIVYNKINITLIFFSLLITISMFFFNFDNTYIIKNNFIDYLVFFGAGFLEALGTVVPGISATALLLLCGLYEIIILMLSNLTNINFIILSLNILLPFTLGLIFGIIIISIIISYFINNYCEKTYSIILGVFLSTILLITIKTFSVSFTFLELLYGIVLFFLGLFFSLILD